MPIIGSSNPRPTEYLEAFQPQASGRACFSEDFRTEGRFKHDAARADPSIKRSPQQGQHDQELGES